MRSLIAHSRAASALSCDAGLEGERLQSAKYSPPKASAPGAVARYVCVAAPCASDC